MDYIYDLFERGLEYYNKFEFLQLIYQAREENIRITKENNDLKKENARLRTEIATMNANIVASLEHDLRNMRTQVNTIIKPIMKIQKCRTIEELDI